MTDWVIGTGLMSKNAKYLPPNAAKVAHAGTNLFMPGSKGEFKQIKKGLTDGTVTREELVHNATETYRMVNELRK
jgi:beta-glucosidase